MTQESFLCASVGLLLDAHRGKPVVIHNEATGNSIVHIVFSVSGTSIRDRIVMSVRNVKVTEWNSSENVIMSDLIGIDVRESEIRILVESSAVAIRFSATSTLKVIAVGITFSGLPNN